MRINYCLCLYVYIFCFLYVIANILLLYFKDPIYKPKISLKNVKEIEFTLKIKVGSSGKESSAVRQTIVVVNENVDELLIR